MTTFRIGVSCRPFHAMPSLSQRLPSLSFWDVSGSVCDKAIAFARTTNNQHHQGPSVILIRVLLFYRVCVTISPHQTQSNTTTHRLIQIYFSSFVFHLLGTDSLFFYVNRDFLFQRVVLYIYICIVGVHRQYI